MDVSKTCDLLVECLPECGVRVIGSDWIPTGDMNFAVVSPKSPGRTIWVKLNAFTIHDWGPDKLVYEVKRQIRSQQNV